MWSVGPFIISASWFWALQEPTISVLSKVSAVSIDSVVTYGFIKERNFGNSLIEEIGVGDEKCTYYEFLLSVKFENRTDHTAVCLPVNEFLWWRIVFVFVFFESLSLTPAMQTKKKGRFSVSWASSLNSRSQLKWSLTGWQGEWLAWRRGFCFLLSTPL